jgi:hypothetical protein
MTGTLYLLEDLHPVAFPMADKNYKRQGTIPAPQNHNHVN